MVVGYGFIQQFLNKELFMRAKLAMMDTAKISIAY